MKRGGKRSRNVKRGGKRSSSKRGERRKSSQQGGRGGKNQDDRRRSVKRGGRKRLRSCRMMDTTSHAGNCGYELSLQQQENIQYIWGDRTEEMSRLWDNFHNSRNEMLMAQSTPLEPSVRNKIQQENSTPLEEEEVLRRDYFQHLAPQPSVLERRLSWRCEELQNTVRR